MKKFTDLTPEGERFFMELQRLVEREVRVGFQGDEGAYEDGTSVVEVAAYNEFGTSDTPARPFMKQAFEKSETKLRNQGKVAGSALANGESAEVVLNKLGVLGKGIVQDEISSGDFAPNAPSTIAKKGSSTPLIDTGHMRQSVNYVIKKR